MAEKKKKPQTEEEKEVVLTKKQIEKREEKQTKWVFIIIAIVFLAVIIPFAAVNLSKTFNYANVKWQIQQDGDKTTGVKWYVTSFEKTTVGGISYGDHTTYLRNDPRKNDVPYEIENLGLRKRLIFSFDPEILEYDEQSLGTMELGKITMLFPFIEERRVSTTNATYAKENGLNYSNCNNKLKESTIFEVVLGDENRIYEKSEDCYVLEVKDVEDYLLVAEKFVIEIIREFNA